MARALNHILQRRHLITHMSSALYCFSIGPCTRHGARYSTKKSVSKVDSNETNNQVQVGTAEVVKENLKSAGYLGVIVGGIGVTALIIYTLCSELFSSSSPYAVYSEARVRCMEHPKVMDVLGAPVKAFGEETRRGRRRHITHLYYVKDGVKYMRQILRARNEKAGNGVRGSEGERVRWLRIFIPVRYGESCRNDRGRGQSRYV